MNELGNNVPKFNKEKSMKIIKVIIAIIILLFITTIGISAYMIYLQKQQFKVYLDGQSITSYPEDLVSFEDDDMYFSIKDFGKLVDYTPNNGEYKQYSEDTASCYLQNNNEAATYTLNSTKMYKNIITETTDNSGNGQTNATAIIDREYFQLEEPVKQINDKLYTTLQGISIGCNSYIYYDKKNNSLNIYTLPYLEKKYTNTVKNAAITGEKALFSNKKGILYDLIVVQDPTTSLYGVSNTKNEEIIGRKYSEIKFIESTQTFIVKTTEGKMGIIAKDGTTKIKPDYDEIKPIDNDREFYLAKNNNKYGVINKNGKIIIYLEYDKIGIDTDRFKNYNLDNDYILYNSVIPVQKGKAWGLIDLNGNKVADTIYDELGCVETSSSNGIAVENALLIPPYEGIVVCKDKKYGLINAVGKELIPVAVSDFYNVTTSGKVTYYLTYENQIFNVLDYLQNTLKIPPVEKNGTVTTETNTIIDSNTTSNTTTDTNSATSTTANEIMTQELMLQEQQPTEIQNQTPTTTNQQVQTTENPQ